MGGDGKSGGQAAQDFWDGKNVTEQDILDQDGKPTGRKQYWPKGSPGWVYFYLASLIAAYFAKYFCTSFLYVVQPLWRKDQNISHPELAHQFILGYVMSMIGKRAAGNWADNWGGKNVQMLSLGVYIPVVIVWGYGGTIAEALGVQNHWYVFLAMWLCNGFFALGLSWVAIMVCASNWIPDSKAGRLLAVVGCAPELGDASARAFLGPIIKHGWSGISIGGFGAAGDWPTVSLSAALASILLSTPMTFIVPEAPPGYAAEKKKAKAVTDKDGLNAPLMTLTCTMCGLLYAIRTMFLLYSVTWLSQVYCRHYHPNMDFLECDHDAITVGNVATASLLFTFFGMFSVLLSGVCKDELNRIKRWDERGWILAANSVVLLLTVVVMLVYDTELPFPAAAFAVGMIGFGDFGPYKTMSGAFAVDIGGKSRKGDVSAWMGVASNGSAAIILMISGYFPAWSDMFKILVVLAVGCIICALLIVYYDKTILKPMKEAAQAREMAEPFLNVE